MEGTHCVGGNNFVLREGLVEKVLRYDTKGNSEVGGDRVKAGTKGGDELSSIDDQRGRK